MKITSVLGVVATLAFSVAAPAIAQPLKFIHGGWERPNSSDLKTHLTTIEKTPYDGAILSITGKDDSGRNIDMKPIFRKRKWKQEWFLANVDELKSINNSRLKENFILVSVTPDHIDWFSDEDWDIVTENFRIAAWAAKQGGARGLVFDPEMYQQQVFTFEEQRFLADLGKKPIYSFAQYQEKVRQRGQEVMAAIRKEFPDIVILGFFLNSQNMNLNHPADLQYRPYGLLPAFFNGWLDEASEEMVFVDGVENTYYSDGELDYLRITNDMRTRAIDVVAPENRARFKKQVQVGIAFYLDSYTNPPGSQFYHAPLNGSRAERLKHNLSTAAKVTDGYIWTWGEKYRWWPTQTKGVEESTWEEMLPGLSAHMQRLKAPQQFQQQLYLQSKAKIEKGELVNLIKNGGFDEFGAQAENAPNDWSSLGMPRYWSNWQKTRGENKNSPRPKGIFAADEQAMKLTGMKRDGVLIQEVPVQPGKFYSVRARHKALGNGESRISIQWKNAGGKWIKSNHNVFFPGQNTQQWQLIEGVFQAPAEAVTAVVLLGTAYQYQETDAAWFDDVEMYLLPEG